MSAEGRKDSAYATTTARSSSLGYGGTGGMSATDRRVRRQPGIHRSGALEAARSFWPVTLFVIGLAIPWYIPLGPLRLSVYRLVLLLALVPCLVSWVSGKAGRIRLPDVLLFAFCIWCSLSLITVHGLALSIEPAGMLWIETMGSYLLARCYIRTADDFYRMARLLFWVVAALLPFAVIELVTGAKPLLRLFGVFLPTVYDIWQTRFGLQRVQGPFEHSILFGGFCGSLVALTHLVVARRKTTLQRWSMTGIVAATSFLSLSSAAIASVFGQVFLLSWNWLLRNVKVRWKILWGLAAAMYLFVAVASNRSVVEVFISRLTFDKETAYFRLLIWDYGSTSALNHPLFGVGLGEWERPIWMPPSIDMFWLIHAVRHGIPAAILAVLFFLSAYVAVGFRKGLDSRLQDYRTAYLIAMTAFFLVGWTVHFWNATYVLFMFLVGSGMWLLDAKAGERTPTAAQRGRLD